MKSITRKVSIITSVIGLAIGSSIISMELTAQGYHPVIEKYDDLQIDSRRTGVNHELVKQIDREAEQLLSQVHDDIGQAGLDGIGMLIPAPFLIVA